MMGNQIQPTLPPAIATEAARHHLGALQSIHRPIFSVILVLILTLVIGNAIAAALTFFAVFVLIMRGNLPGIAGMIALLYLILYVLTPVLSIVYLVQFFLHRPGAVYVFERGLVSAKKCPEAIPWERIEELQERTSFLNKQTGSLAGGGAILLALFLWFFGGFLGMFLLALPFVLTWPVAALLGPTYLLRCSNGDTNCSIDKSLKNSRALLERIRQESASRQFAKALSTYSSGQSVRFGYGFSVTQDGLQRLTDKIAWQDIGRLEFNEQDNILTIIRSSGDSPLRWRLGLVSNVQVALALANHILRSREPLEKREQEMKGQGGMG